MLSSQPTTPTPSYSKTPGQAEEGASSTNKPRPPLTPTGKLIYIILRAPWLLICLFTLGFPAKYRERLRLFKGLHPIDDTYEPWKTRPVYSDRGSSDNSLLTMRQKQQEEWDRLNITMSVITATSAAALAIQGLSPSVQMYWLVTTFYSIAFGLSLEGLILITYMTISAGGSSDEAIARLARGILRFDPKHPRRYRAPRLSAFIMALPAIFATYSSLSLLMGLAAMVLADSSEGVETQGKEYNLATMIPVGVGFLFLCSAIILCEIGTWVEIYGRKGIRLFQMNGTGKKYPEEDKPDEPPHCSSCCPKKKDTPSTAQVPHNSSDPHNSHPSTTSSSPPQ